MDGKLRSNEYQGIPKVVGSASFEDEYRIVALRKEGQDHAKKREKPCQDMFEFGRCGHYIWLAVADGVGSETHSQFGAQIACGSVGPLLYEMTKGGDAAHAAEDGFDDIGRKILHNARFELQHYAAQTELDLQCLSTTLQVVIIDLKLDIMSYAAIGNGNCIATFKDGKSTVVGHGRPSSSVGTPNLGKPDFKRYLFTEKFGTMAEVKEILIFTDGLDRMFIKPRIDEPADAVSADAVAYVSKCISEASGEFQSLNALSKFFSVADGDHADLLGDDLSLLAFKNIDLSLQTGQKVDLDPAMIAAPQPAQPKSDHANPVAKTPTTENVTPEDIVSSSEPDDNVAVPKSERADPTAKVSPPNRRPSPTTIAWRS